jgi:hypothetical protein
LQKLHNNVEKNIVEDFYDHPSKKAKYVESSIMDHSLPSHTITASSLVGSECEESIGRKSDDQINSEPLPTPPSPIKSTLSPLSELNKEETISADDDKKTFLADDDKQQYKPVINNVIYDNLPQGKILICYFYIDSLIMNVYIFNVYLLYLFIMFCRLYNYQTG